MRLFLDTNVLIDLFGQRDPFFKSALTLQIAEEFNDVELWASAKSFTDAFYVLSRQFRSDDIQNAFALSAEFLHVCSIDGDDILCACESKWPDFEDCLVNVAAQKVDASFIITRDAAGFERSSLKTLSPNKVVDLLAERGLQYEDIVF